MELVLRTAVCVSIAGTVLMAENPRSHVVSVVRVDKKTGRLVRSIVVSPKPAAQSTPSPPADDGVRVLVNEMAKSLDVSPLLVDSVIQVESNYNPYAISPKGAQGLMQLMPATARRFGVKDSFDAKQNIEGGVKYLKFLQDTFKDDRLALAAYNAGEGAVNKYGNVPPYPETMKYVDKVGKKYGQAKTAAEKTAAEKSATLAKAEEKPKPADNEPRHIKGYMDQEGRLHIETR